ncbi:MAG TPA: DUF3788 family protein [Melioribacteraceae bacterium]|mgnify:CR=1 FL=1|nr:DUF3788 family protein [Melioribacteraceae bacterium]
METKLLTDSREYPTEEIIFSHIGRSKSLWNSLFTIIKTDYPQISTEWRYYNDGKSWLLKAIQKSKTIFWLSIVKSSFRTTFYFGDKAEEYILRSRISPDLKKQFREGKRFGKIRGITILFKTKKEIDYAIELINLKLTLK